MLFLYFVVCCGFCVYLRCCGRIAKTLWPALWREGCTLWATAADRKFFANPLITNPQFLFQRVEGWNHPALLSQSSCVPHAGIKSVDQKGDADIAVAVPLFVLCFFVAAAGARGRRGIP